MDTPGVVRRVVNKPREVIPRNPPINPDVIIQSSNNQNFPFFCFIKTLLDVPEFNFIYNDSDILNVEISELYTYSEEPEFVWNAEAFNILFQAKCNFESSIVKMSYFSSRFV